MGKYKRSTFRLDRICQCKESANCRMGETDEHTMQDFLTNCARDPEAQAYFLRPAYQIQSTDPMRPNTIGLGAYALVVPFQRGMEPAEPQLSGDASVSQSLASSTLYFSPST